MGLIGLFFWIVFFAVLLAVKDHNFGPILVIGLLILIGWLFS